ncbi:MAG: type I secretion system permease/ATPase [Pseudomonadota bacterium]
MNEGIDALVGCRQENDSGLTALLVLLKVLGIPATKDDLLHKSGKHENLAVSDILFLARDHLGLRAKQRTVRIQHLNRYPLPAIAQMNDGRFVVLAKAEADFVIVQESDKPTPEKLATDDFLANFSRRLIFIGEQHGREHHDAIRHFGLRWFFAEFFHDKFLGGQVMLSAFIAQIFALVTPLFTMVIIDKVFSSSGVSTLEVLIIGLFIIALFDFLINTFRRYLVHHLSNKIDVVLVARLFRHLTRLPMAFFSGRQTGDTVARLKEVEGIRSFITGSALMAIIDFPFTFVFLAVMFLFSPPLTGIVFVALLLSFGLYGLAGPALKDALQRKFVQGTDSQSFLIEAVGAMETIKATAVEPQMHRQWENHLVTQSRYNAAVEHLSGHLTHLAGLINKLTVALCLWIGAVAVLDGSMTAGQLIAFNMLVGRVMGPAQRIAQLLHQLHQIRISVKRVADIFDTPQEPALHAARSSLPSLKGRVTLERVSFQYAPDAPFILQDVNLDIPQGQVVGIVGRSGAGKTTLLRLLQRLYLPSKGRLYIDGINLAEIDPSWLRRNIGVVLQETLLLNRSIRDNIALANPAAPMERVEAAAHLAGADEFIRALPKAYDTVVGERGALLSAGQRQRIALARALLTDPKILILDEATSALDYESERQVQDNMRRICEDRTVFIVAHRLSSLRIADRILTLENGHVIEDGRPDELLKGKGRFAALYALHGVAG